MALLDPPSRPVAHLLHGFIGAGKTHFARHLSTEHGARRFSADAWMVKRHGPCPAAEFFPQWFAEIETEIWSAAAETVGSGRDVILDFGFWERAAREAARIRVAVMGAEVRWYSVQCPRPLMRSRTLARSASLPAETLWIDAAAFDALWARFDPFGTDEGPVTVVDGADPVGS